MTESVLDPLSKIYRRVIRADAALEAALKSDNYDNSHRVMERWYAPAIISFYCACYRNPDVTFIPWSWGLDQWRKLYEIRCQELIEEKFRRKPAAIIEDK